MPRGNGLLTPQAQGLMSRRLAPRPTASSAYAPNFTLKSIDFIDENNDAPFSVKFKVFQAGLMSAVLNMSFRVMELGK